MGDTKLIYHNASGYDIPDDPSYPWLLTASFSPPEFMTFAFVGLFGGSELVKVRGMSKESLEIYAQEKGLASHPRLTNLEITEQK